MVQLGSPIVETFAEDKRYTHDQQLASRETEVGTSDSEQLGACKSFLSLQFEAEISLLLLTIYCRALFMIIAFT
jgi:hypothetical protein